MSFGFIVFNRNESARTTCFNVDIIDDSVTENVEHFSFVLELDTFMPQPGILVQPNVTEISIIDNDGRYCVWKASVGRHAWCNCIMV